jgi:hypothetical protein
MRKAEPITLCPTKERTATISLYSRTSGCGNRWSLQTIDVRSIYRAIAQLLSDSSVSAGAAKSHYIGYFSSLSGDLPAKVAESHMHVQARSSCSVPLSVQSAGLVREIVYCSELERIALAMTSVLT